MHLRRVHQADLPVFAATVSSAMWDDEVMAFTAPYKERYPVSRHRYVMYRISKRFYSGQFLFLIVSDPTDSSWTETSEEVVLGYACYSTTVKDVVKPCPGGWLGNAFERWALDIWGRYSSTFRLDRSADPRAERYFRQLCEQDMFSDYFASLPAAHKEVKGDQHWELELLGTLPEFRRRGVGKAGLNWGFERARENGVPLVLISSISGEKLYRAVGFQVLNNVNMMPQNGEDAGEMGRTLIARMEHEDFGLGVGKGLSWNTMVWEPESMMSH